MCNGKCSCSSSCKSSCDGCDSNQVYVDKNPFNVDWVDSVMQVKDESGELEEVGTVLAICSNIIFLKPLSDEQLSELSKVVQEAVTHELSKRNL